MPSRRAGAAALRERGGRSRNRSASRRSGALPAPFVRRPAALTALARSGARPPGPGGGPEGSGRGSGKAPREAGPARGGGAAGRAVVGCGVRRLPEELVATEGRAGPYVL